MTNCKKWQVADSVDSDDNFQIVCANIIFFLDSYTVTIDPRWLVEHFYSG